MATAGASARAEVGPIAGCNATDSQADTLQADGSPWLDMEVTEGNALKIRPGLTFTGKAAAENV